MIGNNINNLYLNNSTYLNSKIPTKKVNFVGSQQELGADKLVLSKKVDKTNDGKFSLGVALKNFGNKFISIFKELVTHPVRSIGIALGYGALTCFFPQFGRISILLGVFGGAKSIGQGLFNIGKSIKTGNGDLAEKAFGDLGDGSSTLLISGVFARGMAQVRGAKYLKSTKTSWLGKTADWFKTTFRSTKEEVAGGYKNIFTFGKINYKAAKESIHNKSFNGFLKNRQNALKEIYSKKNVSSKTIKNNSDDIIFSDNSIKSILNIKDMANASWTYLPKASLKKSPINPSRSNLLDVNKFNQQLENVYYQNHQS